MKNVRKFLAMLLAVMLVVSCIPAAFAAVIDEATIDSTKTASLTLYKYDFTNAAKDGVWRSDSYVSTGVYDAAVNNTLGAAARKNGEAESQLGNGQTANGYAIKGVEYTYLKVADIVQFTESEKDGRTDSHIEVLYKINKVLGADLLTALNLADGKNSYANANALDNTSWYYQSDVLITALRNALAANATTTKNALEAYVKAKGGVAMPETDADGKSSVADLPLGLYLLVETRVPEMVTSTTNPFFISLPMTSVNGGMTDGTGTGVTTGGHDWLYDVTIYPKNETGIVTLEKTVREAKADTGKNNASAVITDGFAHTATASDGDTLEYQIISTLPTITSAATNLTDYTFVDLLSRGLSYTGEVTLEFFTDKGCTQSAAKWTEADGKFTVTKTENTDKSHTMTIAMTAAGLAEINAANTGANNDNGALYAGYSNYTLRITYTAKVNSDESMVYGDKGNENTVVLTWKRSNTDYFDTLIDDCHVFTYAIDLSKKFSDGKDAQDLFDHVLFKVQNKTDGYYVQAALNEAEGIWYVTGHTDKEEEATALHPVTWNGKKGQLVLKGVEDDEYILTEIETANGYTLLKNAISVVISAADDAARPCDVYTKDDLGVIQNDPRYSFDGGVDLRLANIPQTQLAHNYLMASAKVDGNDVTMLEDEADTGSTNAIAPLEVVNTWGFDLPATGEWGALLLPVAGAVAMAAALVLFVVMLPKRKHNEQ